MTTQIDGFSRTGHLQGEEVQLRRNKTGLKSILNILQYHAETTQEFLDHALDEAIKITESQIGYIYFYHEDRKQFVLNTWSKEVMKECEIVNPQTCYELDKTGIWGEAVRQRKPIILNNFQGDHPLKKGYPEGHVPLRKFITVPVFKENQIVAVVGVANKRSDYDEMDVLQLTLLMDAVWKFVDIKMGEEALQKSEAHNRQLFDSSPDGIVLIGPDGCITRANIAQAHMFRYDSSDDLIGIQAIHLVAPASRGCASQIMQRRLKGENIQLIEYELLRRDGTTFYGQISATILRNPDNTVSGYICITRDTTERRRVEESLHNSQALLASIVDSTSDLIWSVDPGQFGLLSFNHSLSDYFFKHRGIIIQVGMRPEDLYSNEVFIKAWRGLYRRALAEGSYTTDYLGIAGAVVMRVTFNLLNRDGKVFGISVFGKDITERKRAEDEKAKLEAQLQQAQKMESVGRLASGVAHDFNNMLSVIIGYAEMALSTLDPSDPLHESMQEILSASLHSTDVVQQLLTFARKQIITPQIIDLNAAVAKIVKMLRRLIGEDIDLLWKPADEVWPVKMDASQIDQLLANLAVNARDAIQGVGKITIETANITIDEAYRKEIPYLELGDYVMLSVKDDGCGMDKEMIVNIFEPFFTTKETGKGTGLGLATVYGIIKQNKGFIDVFSEPGQGSLFKLYLPRCHAIGVALETNPSEKVLAGGKETVLLVEDNPVILKLGNLMLEQLKYDVLTANRPSEAIRLARDHKGEIHLLLTDVVMPEMNGRDLANQMLSLFPKLKILYMSGYTASVIERHGVLEEGIHFIQKPFSKKELAAKVRKALDQA
jgi:PAS domain S-box-containing protein